MIAPATLADLDAVLEIERHSFRASWTRETFERELATPHARIDVRRDRGVIVGFNNYWLVVPGGRSESGHLHIGPGVEHAGEVHILSIATHPDHRRRGLAGELLLHALDAGRAIGATVATLEVRRGNAPAIALYERHGFRTVHVRARYYADGDEDALVMTTEITDRP